MPTLALSPKPYLSITIVQTKPCLSLDIAHLSLFELFSLLTPVAQRQKLALLDAGMNQEFNASRRGKRPFAPTQIHASIQQHPKTHYRQSDWEVTRVEAYTPEIPVGMGFDMIVICYCQYSPVNAPLKPMPERQVSIDSFGGDETAYGQWLESQKRPAEVA
jgi:hypothetical protein